MPKSTPTPSARWDKPRCSANPLQDAAGFRQALGHWFAQHGRDYPWRRTTDPYAIWVSEVMLQQTRIATVLEKRYYERFLAAFPNVQALAAADDAPLLKAWEGLGYYRRARMMRSTAQAVVAQHAGHFPSDLAALLSLPGIGRYTAGAIRAFAFGLPAVLVDGNVIRVLTRLMDLADPTDQSATLAKLWEWAAALADPDHPGRHHAALMELGQTLCSTGMPDCLACPVARYCASKEPESLPRKTPKPPPTEVDEHALWAVRADGQVLLHHESGQRRTGLWKLPLRQRSDLADLPPIHQVRYSITRFRVTLRIYDLSSAAEQLEPAPGDCWIPLCDWSDLPMAAPFRRAISHLLDHGKAASSRSFL